MVLNPRVGVRVHPLLPFFTNLTLAYVVRSGAKPLARLIARFGLGRRVTDTVLLPVAEWSCGRTDRDLGFGGGYNAEPPTALHPQNSNGLKKIAFNHATK